MMKCHITRISPQTIGDISRLNGLALYQKNLAGTTIIEISRKNVEEEKPLSPVTTSELWEEN